MECMPLNSKSFVVMLKSLVTYGTKSLTRTAVHGLSVKAFLDIAKFERIIRASEDLTF
jgi:hypothetical protein